MLGRFCSPLGRLGLLPFGLAWTAVLTCPVCTLFLSPNSCTACIAATSTSAPSTIAMMIFLSIVVPPLFCL